MEWKCETCEFCVVHNEHDCCVVNAPIAGQGLPIIEAETMQCGEWRPIGYMRAQFAPAAHHDIETKTVREL